MFSLTWPKNMTKYIPLTQRDVGFTNFQDGGRTAQKTDFFKSFPSATGIINFW